MNASESLASRVTTEVGRSLNVNRAYSNDVNTSRFTPRFVNLLYDFLTHSRRNKTSEDSKCRSNTWEISKHKSVINLTIQILDPRKTKQNGKQINDIPHYITSNSLLLSAYICLRLNESRGFSLAAILSLKISHYFRWLVLRINKISLLFFFVFLNRHVAFMFISSKTIKCAERQGKAETRKSSNRYFS